MGSICCCMHPHDFDEFISTDGAAHRSCNCITFLLHTFFNAYAALFRRGESFSLRASSGIASVSSTALDSTLSDAYRALPRPLPYDADPRYIRAQRDGLIARSEKGSGQSHGQSEPLITGIDNGTSFDSAREKWGPASQDECKGQRNGVSQKLSSTLTATGIGYLYASEDEDVCPTCLEEYSSENPKILTKCGHYFHLGCIYEWMERSDNCPVCGKVMVIDEET